MRISRKTGRRRIAPVAAGVLAAVTAALMVPGTAHATAAHRGCVTFDNVSETVTGGNTNDTGEPGPSVGDTGSYTTVLFDESGAPLGSVDADVTIVYIRPSDGHNFFYITEDITLPGGVVHTAGVVDHDAIDAGQTPYISAVGVSGDYVGKQGGRQFEVVSAPLFWATRIYLCGGHR